MTGQAAAFDKMRILIVEDQADMRSMIRHMLSELSITQIFEAADAGLEE